MPAPKNCVGYAARDTSAVFSPYHFNRREVGANDVKIDIHFCGICHSDLHTAKGDWGPANYPVVTGHEIVGIVAEVGSDVKGFKTGDRAGVGCMVGSCLSCKTCAANEEQFCSKVILTYNTPEGGDEPGQPSQGGYSSHIVVPEHFALHFPENLPMDAGAPLLCAGITTYSPLVQHGLNKPGKKVGVIGMGGLGHLAIQIAAAFGAEVTVLSTSDAKKEEALGFGAKHFIVSKDKEAMSAAAGTLDGILDTAAVKKDMAPYLNLLAPHGAIVAIGGVTDPYHDVAPVKLLSKSLSIAGSMIGGIKQTQEMLDFCAEKGITAAFELIPMDYLNTAMERLGKADVRYRFVLDIRNTLRVEA